MRAVERDELGAERFYEVAPGFKPAGGRLARLLQDIRALIAVDDSVLDRDDIDRLVRSVLLLEGAGGLLSPITWDWSVVELARTLGATALVVGRDRHDVINDALLTLSALELAGVEPAVGQQLPLFVPQAARNSRLGWQLARLVLTFGEDRIRKVGLTDPDAPLAERRWTWRP